MLLGALLGRPTVPSRCAIGGRDRPVAFGPRLRLGVLLGVLLVAGIGFGRRAAMTAMAP
jgi:hypothetical protein